METICINLLSFVLYRSSKYQNKIDLGYHGF